MKKLETLLNAKHGEIDDTLTLLEVAGAVEKEDGSWIRTPIGGISTTSASSR